jgi:hypothetical protein
VNDERLALSDDPRDLRIEQLEHALSARVVIEQAKGIIFERFGLSMSDSFELLRHAARAHRVKLRRLAEELVATRATPTAIIESMETIRRHPSRYVLKAGHEVEGVDRVIDRIDGLVIVEEAVDDAAPTPPDDGRSP